jgi:hypothetical protein
MGLVFIKIKNEYNEDIKLNIATIISYRPRELFTEIITNNIVIITPLSIDKFEELLESHVDFY